LPGGAQGTARPAEEGTRHLSPAILEYLRRLELATSKLQLIGLGQGVQIELPIQQAYIPLNVVVARDLKTEQSWHFDEKALHQREHVEENVLFSDIFKWAVRFESRGVLLLGDPLRLGQILSNLASNAVKFTPEGGRVLIAAAAADGRATVEVSDSGCGVPSQDREDIFRRFYRGGRDGAAPGYGLGLSIVAAVAKLHGFRLTVEDNTPGARFALRGDCLVFDSDDAPRDIGAAPPKSLRSSA